jgi:polyisoprenoid-binding protein YceI
LWKLHGRSRATWRGYPLRFAFASRVRPALPRRVTHMTGGDLSALSGTYTIDASHSRIGFVTRRVMVTKVRGSSKDFEGTATLDGADPSQSSARVVIQAASIDTRNGQRDGHLASIDFFDMETYPTIEGSVVINRKDWGVTWNAPLESGGVLVGEKITLEFELSAIKDS